MTFLFALMGISHVGIAADTMSQAFLRYAIRKNTIQMQPCEHAQENGENPDVKAFSDALLVDCTLANKQASKIGLEVSTEQTQFKRL